jgi:hypothetical protein
MSIQVVVFWLLIIPFSNVLGFHLFRSTLLPPSYFLPEDGGRNIFRNVVVPHYYTLSKLRRPLFVM